MDKLGLDPRFKKYCSEPCRLIGWRKREVREKTLRDFRNGFDLEAWKKEHKPIVDARGETWVT